MKQTSEEISAHFHSFQRVSRVCLRYREEHIGNHSVCGTPQCCPLSSSREGAGARHLLDVGAADGAAVKESHIIVELLQRWDGASSCMVIREIE
jgi:hypothetical protein